MKKVLAVGALALVVIFAWRSFRSPDRAADEIVAAHHDSKLLVDRLWIDHIPKNERDMIKIFAMLTQEPVGIFQSASMWAGSYEVFKYEVLGNEVRAVFPQKGDREKIFVNAEKCQDHHMDYCLELKGASRGTKRYYSMKGWEVREGDEQAARARIGALVEQLTPRQ